MFLRNKSIIIKFLRHSFGVHNPIMVLSPVKKSESGETSAQIKHRLQTKSVQNRSKKNMWVDVHERGQQGMKLFTGGSVNLIF